MLVGRRGLGRRLRGRRGGHPGGAAAGHGQGEAADVAGAAPKGNGQLLQESDKLLQVKPPCLPQGLCFSLRIARACRGMQSLPTVKANLAGHCRQNFAPDRQSNS